MAAAAMQILVWVVGLRLQSPRPTAPSSLVAHGLLYQVIADALEDHGLEAAQVASVLFVANLLPALLSGIAWYGIGWLGLGPKWGVWVGLLWVLHPSFAFLANQADRLNVLIALVCTSWCVLLWWRRSRKTSAALILGLLAATILSIGFQSLALVAIAVPGMLLSARGANGGRITGAITTLTAFVVGTIFLAAVIALPRFPTTLSSGPLKKEVSQSPSQPRHSWPRTAARLAVRVSHPGDALRLRAVVGLFFIRDQLLEDSRQIVARFDTDLWNVLEDGSGSHIAQAALAVSPPGTADHPPAGRFLIDQCRVAPAQTLAWLAQRMWKSTYATRDRRTHYPFILLQFGWLVPAFWGLWIALRYRPWRWLAVTAGLFAGSQWVLVGVVEPLARNLVPVGGFVILFALVGVTDVYERFFGRRLTAPAPASRPARLKRIQQNLSDSTRD
ncbi:MAG: hypothetical protein ACUVXJ_18350 [Phycisphaerae bacterium]